MKKYFKYDVVKYIIMFLIANVIGFVFTTATAQSVFDLIIFTNASDFQEFAVTSERYILCEEKDSTTTIRVIDCAGSKLKIYTAIERSKENYPKRRFGWRMQFKSQPIFICDILNENWVINVPLKPGSYIIATEDEMKNGFIRNFRVLGEKDIDNSKNEHK